MNVILFIDNQSKMNTFNQDISLFKAFLKNFGLQFVRKDEKKMYILFKKSIIKWIFKILFLRKDSFNE